MRGELPREFPILSRHFLSSFLPNFCRIVVQLIDLAELIALSLVLGREADLRPVLGDLPIIQPDIQLLDLSNAKVSEGLGCPVDYCLDGIFPAGSRGPN